VESTAIVTKEGISRTIEDAKGFRSWGQIRGQTERSPFSTNFIKRGTHARADFTSVREKSCPLNRSGSPYGFRQRIGEAISKIQFGGVAARFAEVVIGLTRYYPGWAAMVCDTRVSAT
jgi:hypothetical protein